MPYADSEQMRDYQRRWVAERRHASLLDRVCEGCGSSEKLEWHHLSRDEKVSHKIWSWSAPKREAELAKCIPLCSSCHDAVHARARRAQAVARNPHGTRARYDLGCRCDPCRRGKSEYNAAHPPKRKQAA